MKKLLLISAMLMAMNTWSEPDYQVCRVSGFVDEIEKCAAVFVKNGYIPVGDLIVTEGRRTYILWQAFFKPE